MNENKQLSESGLFSFDEIMQLMDKFSSANIDEFKVETDTSKILFKKNEKGVVNVNTAGSQSVVNVGSNCQEPAAPAASGAAAVTAQNPQAANNTAAADDANIYVVKSPIVGTFYASKEEGGEPLVKVGDKVNKESIVAIIEAMKLMNEITAGAEGVVAEILVENGQLVEYGQELMKIKF